MSVTSTAYDLTFSGGVPQPISVTSEIQGVDPTEAVRLSNNSPWVALVQFGTDPSIYTLTPGEINVWSWASNRGTLKITFPAAPSGANLPATGSILVETSDQGMSDFPGSYPQSIPMTNINISAPSGSIPVTVEGTPNVGISGTVDVAVQGTPTFILESGASVDANITNASLDVSGSTVTADLASGSTVDANVTNATLDVSGSSVAVSGSVSVSNDVTVTPSGTITVQGVAGGTAIGVAGTVAVGSGTIDIGNTPAVTIDSGTVTLGTGSTVALAAGTTVDANITNATLDVSGSTVTADLASGTTVDANITNASVEVAGTVTANIAAGAEVIVTEVQNVTGNVSVVNPSDNALLTRSLPIGADVYVTSGEITGLEGAVVAGTGTLVQGSAPTVDATNQLVVWVVAVQGGSTTADNVLTLSLESNPDYVAMVGGPYTVTLPANSSGASYVLLPFAAIVNTTSPSPATFNYTLTGTPDMYYGVSFALFGESASSAFSNPTLTGAINPTFSFNQLASPFVLSGNGGAADSLALAFIANGHITAASEGEYVIIPNAAYSVTLWYQLFSDGSTDATFTASSSSRPGFVLSESGLYIPQ